MAQLTIDPPALQVPANGGESTHQLSNSGETRLAFKIKCSDNEHYRLKPVYGYVEPGANVAIQVTRLEGPPKDDKLVIQFMEDSPEATDPQAPFKTGTPPLGQVDFQMSAQ